MTRRFYMRKRTTESEPQEKRLSWVCVRCKRPCGEHPRAKGLGANVSGHIVECFPCWQAYSSAWEDAWEVQP